MILRRGVINITSEPICLWCTDDARVDVTLIVE